MITPSERIQAVKEWNESGFHELTCGIDSNHPPLVAAETPFGVYLFCTAHKCGYTQPFWRVPVVVWQLFFERHASQQVTQDDIDSPWFCIECKHDGNTGPKCDNCLMPRR